MLHLRIAAVTAVTVMLAALCTGQAKSDKAVTIVFKDGHQKSFAVSESSRIEFKNNSMVLTQNGRQEMIPIGDVLRMDFGARTTPTLSRNHFVGKWEFEETAGGSTFYVTLNPDGQAKKSIGAPHGTWALVDGEARISWDDGWKDVIRKVGSKHEKFAYEPGKSLSDQPSNVTTANNLNPEPL
jgi:hypothetical protein